MTRSLVYYIKFRPQRLIFFTAKANLRFTKWKNLKIAPEGVTEINFYGQRKQSHIGQSQTI